MADKHFPGQEHLTYREAAEYLNLPLGTLYSLVHHREIPHVRLGRRLVRFSRSALVQWLAEHSVQSASREPRL
jgi:excisionase family DNA binding protein